MIVNRVRLALAVLFVGGMHWLLFGQPFPTATEPYRYVWLALSALIGLVIGDGLLFQCYVLVGPRIGVLLLSMSPIFGTALAWVFLGERLTPQELGAMALALGGVTWVVLERGKGTGARALQPHLRHRYPFWPRRGAVPGDQSGDGQAGARRRLSGAVRHDDSHDVRGGRDVGLGGGDRGGRPHDPQGARRWSGGAGDHRGCVHWAVPGRVALDDCGAILTHRDCLDPDGDDTGTLAAAGADRLQGARDAARGVWHVGGDGGRGGDDLALMGHKSTTETQRTRREQGSGIRDQESVRECLPPLPF